MGRKNLQNNTIYIYIYVAGKLQCHGRAFYKKSKLDLIVRSTKISNLIFVFFAMLKSQHMRVFVFHILNVKKFILFANGLKKYSEVKVTTQMPRT